MHFILGLTRISGGISHEGISIRHVAIDCLMRVQVSGVKIVMWGGSTTPTGAASTSSPATTAALVMMA